MTNEKYIAALKKALGGLDSASQNDIIKEIQSHSAETGSSLLQRFGSPESLAEQYLDGEIIKTPVIEKVGGFGKKMFLWVGILASTMVLAMAFFIWNVSSDDFNYADESAAELDSNSADWVTKDWAAGTSLDIEQSSAVLYWHDKPTVRWQCNSSELPVMDEGKLTIRQSRCLIMMPKMDIKIVTDQTQIVLVKPQASLDMSIKQTSLRIAENDTQYRYVVNANRSNFDDLKSYDEAEHTIKIESLEAKITPYEQD